MGISKARYMKQTCVYWAPGNESSGGRAHDIYGQPVYTAAVEKACRWESESKIFVSAKGTEETSKAIIFIDDVVVGGLLMLGELSSSLDLDDPRNNEGAWEIRMVEIIPNRTASVLYTWAYV
jgi:hypothetical protein